MNIDWRFSLVHTCNVHVKVPAVDVHMLPVPICRRPLHRHTLHRYGVNLHWAMR